MALAQATKVPVLIGSPKVWLTVANSRRDDSAAELPHIKNFFNRITVPCDSSNFERVVNVVEMRRL